MPIWLELVLIFQIKHFLADYPLQRPYMLKKFLPSWDFFPSLSLHCAVHGSITFLILLAYDSTHLWYLAIADFVVHFIMDRLKAGPKYLGRYKPLTPIEFKRHVSLKVFVQGLTIPTSDGPEVLAEWFEKVDKERKQRLFSNTLFWWSLGLDQMVHHVTHYAIIWWMLY